jgi:acyl-CoA synthetase (NDP forming)
MKTWKRAASMALLAAMAACGVSDGEPAGNKTSQPEPTIVPFDVAGVTCREAAELDEYEYYLLLMYMQGYVDAKQNNTLFNMDQKAALTEKVETACKADPSLLVLREFLKASGTK